MLCYLVRLVFNAQKSGAGQVNPTFSGIDANIGPEIPHLILGSSREPATSAAIRVFPRLSGLNAQCNAGAWIANVLRSYKHL
jgi:hypothetical protein